MTELEKGINRDIERIRHEEYLKRRVFTRFIELFENLRLSENHSINLKYEERGFVFGYTKPGANDQSYMSVKGFRGRFGNEEYNFIALQNIIATEGALHPREFVGFGVELEYPQMVMIRKDPIEPQLHVYYDSFVQGMSRLSFRQHLMRGQELRSLGLSPLVDLSVRFSDEDEEMAIVERFDQFEVSFDKIGWPLSIRRRPELNSNNGK
jgi:hypothetical protein